VTTSRWVVKKRVGGSEKWGGGRKIAVNSLEGLDKFFPALNKGENFQKKKEGRGGGNKKKKEKGWPELERKKIPTENGSFPTQKQKRKILPWGTIEESRIS